MIRARRHASSSTVFHSIANVDDFTAAAVERGSLHRFVSADDLASARRHAADQDRTRALAARALARLLGARVLGLAPINAQHLSGTVAACTSCGGPHGKPGIQGLSMNWSRSGDWIMAAAALPPTGPVGVDIEHIPARLFAGFDEHCLTPAERGDLARQDAAARIGLWVAKEAVLKACGSGLSIPPAAVGTSPTPALVPGAAPGTDARILDGLSVNAVSAPKGHAAAVACRVPIALESVDPTGLFAA